jgi:pimeloyl-ACP methyl ester carboxylesterase
MAIVVVGHGDSFTGRRVAPRETAGMWQPIPIPLPAPAIEGRVTLVGTQLWYSDSGGDGVPVVLLHAATGSPQFWAYQQPVLARAGYRTILYARRGCAGSGPIDPAAPGNGTEDLRGLLAALGVTRAHFVANAAGGMFALDYAISWPHDVRSLAFVSSWLRVTDPEYVALGERIRPPFFHELPAYFQELGPSYRAGNPAGTAAWEQLYRTTAAPLRVPQDSINAMTWAEVEQLRMPTLLVTGEADLYTPPSVLRLQAQHLPHAEIQVIRDAGHHPEWEQPEPFNEILLDFLARA